MLFEKLESREMINLERLANKFPGEMKRKIWDFPPSNINTAKNIIYA